MWTRKAEIEALCPRGELLLRLPKVISVLLLIDDNVFTILRATNNCIGHSSKGTVSLGDEAKLLQVLNALGPILGPKLLGHKMIVQQPPSRLRIDDFSRLTVHGGSHCGELHKGLPQLFNDYILILFVDEFASYADNWTENDRRLQ